MALNGPEEPKIWYPRSRTTSKQVFCRKDRGSRRTFGATTHAAEQRPCASQLLCTWALTDEHLPTNIGNPQEITILQFAERVREHSENARPNIFKPLPQPRVRA
jgi:hypothetical protein